MKPLEAADRLATVVKLLEVGEPLPPGLLRLWFVGALKQRLQDPQARLDQLLGLSSRAGRGQHIGAAEPERDRRLRMIAATLPGSIGERAKALHEMNLRRELRNMPCRVPGVRQLMRILADTDT